MRIKFEFLDRLRFLVNRVRERLWVKPLAICVASVLGVFVATAVDGSVMGEVFPAVSIDTVEKLLSIMASSMLVIAVFAVTSLVSAYTSASTTATPRSLRLVIADDKSQNALSTFVGAFIFSVIALVAIKNESTDGPGNFALFSLTLAVLAIVIFTFVRWTDRVARLGRLSTTIEKVELATAAALARRRRAPRLHGLPVGSFDKGGTPVFSPVVGYVCRVDVASLQEIASEHDGCIRVAALPGTFAAPGRPLAYIVGGVGEIDPRSVAKAFVVASERYYDDDPRFGLVVLSEIASRALSPGINDPGTAIGVIGTLVRLFNDWYFAPQTDDADAPDFDRVEVPEIMVSDMFDDAFASVARDGAGVIEVMIRLQKALASLAALGEPMVREAAMHQSRTALARAEEALLLDEEKMAIRRLSERICS